MPERTGQELLAELRRRLQAEGMGASEFHLLPVGCVLLTAEEAETVHHFYGEAIDLIRELADDLKRFYVPDKGWPPHIQHAQDLRDHTESLALLSGGDDA